MNPFSDTPQIAPTTEEPILVEINARMVPLMLRALNRYKYPSAWVDEVNYQNGLQQVNRLQEALLTGTTQIVEAVDRLYRLMDEALNGTTYANAELDPEAPPNIIPAIPAVPDDPLPNAGSLRAVAARLWQLAENSGTGQTFAGSALSAEGTPALSDALSWRERLEQLQGTTGGWFGIGAQPVTLANILQASRINTPADEGLIADGFEEILLAASSGGNVAQTAAQFLGIAADTATDGGLAAMQLVTALAQTATAGAQAAQTDRLIAEISMLNRALHGADAAGGNTVPGRAAILPDALFNAQGGNEVSIVDWTQAGVAAAQEISALINVGTPPGTVLSLLDDIRSATRQLAGLEAAGAVVEGSALRLLLEQLECICEGVNGPAEPGIPPYDPTACGALDTLGLTSVEETAGQGEINLSWAGGGGTGEPGQAFIASPYDRPAGVYNAITAGVTGSRQLCVQVVSSNPQSTDLPTFTLRPYIIGSGQDGGRPTIQVGEGSNIVEVWGQNTTESFIAYVTDLSPGGATFTDSWRVYIGYGPVG